MWRIERRPARGSRGRPTRGFRLLAPAAALAMVFSAGCAPDMSRQPRYNPLGSSDFFENGQAARTPVEGTVARGQLRLDERLFTGKSGGAFVGNIPFAVDRALLERGRERFDIFCSPCHGRLGDGNGMVVLRGLRRSSSYHMDRLREAPDGYLFDVITNGFGAMPSYASRIEVRDRWAIIGYLRVLQLSQGAKIDDVPGAERTKLLGQVK